MASRAAPITPTRPSWLADEDELPHPAPRDTPPGWSENYLSYVWSPQQEVGIYVHLSRRLHPFDLWDEVVVIALPGGRYVTAKAFGPGRSGAGATVNGVSLQCESPFQRWTKRFVGAGRLADAETYRGGPASDGEHIPVAFELAFSATSPPFDFGNEHLEQTWATGHYEQHGRLSGWLTVGDETYAIEGTGLRDHSWGPRDYRMIGTTTWLHAQFPSGRGLMAVLVTGPPSKPAFTFATVTDQSTVRPVRADGLPLALSLEEAESDFSFTLTDDAECETVEVTMLNPLRAACVSADELALGTFDADSANHHYIDAFARFRWAGETGYGIAERTVDLHPAGTPGRPTH